MRKPKVRTVKVYLAGHINKDSYRWRNKVAAYFKDYQIKSLNPEEFENKGITPIVNLDLAMIKECDVLLANVLKWSPGTAMEIVYAHMWQKPVVLVCKEKLLSDWYLYHSTFYFTSLDQAASHIVHKLEPLLR